MAGVTGVQPVLCATGVMSFVCVAGVTGVKPFTWCNNACVWQVKLTGYEERLGGSLQPSAVEARLKRDIENMQLENQALLRDIEVSTTCPTVCQFCECGSGGVC